jgi:predicted RNase H-like nuclease
MWVAGVDGSAGGWFVVLMDVRSGGLRGRLARSFADVLRSPEAPRVIAADIPIGLLDAAVRGGRSCDREARRLLGWPRSASVFSPPVRAALRADGYAEAQEINRASSEGRVGLSKQAFGILPKIAEVDRVMTPSVQSRVHETHPELSFAEMHDGVALASGKRTGTGQLERIELLRRQGMDVTHDLRGADGATLDDVLDAAALAWSARRIADGTARRVPERPPRDARGLRMEIWR